MNKLSLVFLFLTLIACNQLDRKSKDGIFTLSKTELQDKIKGGWAGQVIGCTYGGPTEFRYLGKMIDDAISIPWDETRCVWYYENAPGLYDDVYMDLTFVDVFEKEGLNAPAASHAQAFANADYMLWHANQAARYNILNGIMPPESGFWTNNPHSDDIDFQIEADFAGLMSPGMVNTASEICDKIGHIMNYGDGWYGGVYVAAMYSLAFVSQDVDFIVNEALKAIPEESNFYQCINDVINLHQQYPEDWTRTWTEVENKWSHDIGCPDGVYRDFNIDAKINAAYIVVGLLYGEGDYTKTLDISTRCGQDSDCNPASAGGILGTMMGYSKLPEEWRKAVYPVEDLDFKYTTMSLNDVYEISMKQALQIISQNGGKVTEEVVTISLQSIQPVNLEVGFENHHPKERTEIGKILNAENTELMIEFNGNGFVLTGSAEKEAAMDDEVLQLEMSIDGGEAETFTMPTNFSKRKHEVAWKYQLKEGLHKVEFKLVDPVLGYAVSANDLLVYSSEQP